MNQSRLHGLKPPLIFTIVFLVALLATDAAAASRALQAIIKHPNDQKRIALVIGNSDYQDAPRLSNPVNDVRAMSAALNKLGFDVTELTNATQKEMNRSISQFGENLAGRNSVALFYFAGHGLQVKGKNYIVPIDAQISGESSIPSETVEVDSVLAQLENSKLSIVILDACRNNPFQKARSIGSGGLAQMDAPKGSFIAYATAPGKTATDGNGGNGLYTRELLKQLQMPGLSLEKVFKQVRVNVAMATSDTQIPWESTSLTGDFYFNGKPVQTTHIDPAELAMWNSIKDSTRSSDFEVYLASYPDGQFSDVAKSTIRLINDAAKQSEEQKRNEEQNKKLANANRQLEQQLVSRKEEMKKLENDLANLVTQKQEMDIREQQLEQKKKDLASHEKQPGSDSADLDTLKKEVALRELQLELQKKEVAIHEEKIKKEMVRLKLTSAPNF